MKPWNQNNLIQFGVILLCVIVIGFTIAVSYFAIKGGGFGSLPIPVVAIGYAIYTFFKKYYKADEVNHSL